MILVPQSLLSRVRSASIGSITFSDHAPVFVDIDILPQRPKQWQWKLNDSLIQSPEVIEEVARELRNFFSSSAEGECAPLLVWEAHKCTNRGILIKIGTRLKKERAQQTLDLLGKIRDLESTHKQTRAIQTLWELTTLRGQLKSLAFERAKAVIAKCKHTFYEHSNKCGRLLARALKAQWAQAFIPELKGENGSKIHTTEGILDQFRKYYTALYNIKRPSLGVEQSREQEAIRAYIRDFPGYLMRS